MWQYACRAYRYILEDKRMFRKIRKAVCCIAAAAIMAVVSVTASADYIYDFTNTDLCDEIKAADYEIYGTEGRFTATLGDSTEEKYISLRFKLFNEYLDQEFWESPDAKVSVDVKLETANKDVIACIPGFNNKWGWVNPSDYITLKSGEWVTVTETASHFHEEFAKGEPAYLLFQVRTNWGAPAQGDITVAVRNFRIVNGKSTESTTTQTTTTAPEETSVPEETSSQPDDTTAPAQETAEPANTLENEGSGEVPATEQATAESKTEEAVTDPTDSTDKPDDNGPAATTAATTIRTAATMATSSAINYSQLYAEPESPIMLILIIVGVAVVIVAAAVIGYLIYRKKKFY